MLLINMLEKNAISRLFFIFIFLISANVLIAQNLSFKHYGLKEGMPQESVFCMTKDKDGFLWYGSTAGIFRFDGNDFFVPAPDTKNNIDITGYRVSNILAKDSLIYLATDQKGLLTYNLETESINQISINDATCSSVSSTNNTVLATLYNKGVLVIKDNNVLPVTFKNLQPKELTASAIFNNQAYIADKSGNVYTFSINNPSFTNLSITKVGSLAYGIKRLKVINDQLLVCSEKGIFKLDNNALKPITIYNENGIYNLKVTDIVSRNSTYYLATYEGLLLCNFSEEKFTVKQQYKYFEKDNEASINANNTYCLHEDDDLLYIGNTTLDITELENPKVFANPLNNIDLADKSTFGILDTEDYLFLGTRNGLAVINNKTKQDTILPYKVIRGFAKDDKNNAWFISANGVWVIPLDTFSFNNPKVYQIPIDKESTSKLNFTNSRSVYKDLKGDIWIVSYSEGFAKFTGNVANQDFSFKNFTSQGLPSAFTLSMIQDNNYNYWMITQKGLSKFTENKGKITIEKNYSEKDGLATSGVLSAYVGSDNTLWVSSRKGLNKYLPETDTFKYYNQRNGLTNTFVYHAIEDRKNNLWLSTNGGLFKFNPKTETCTNYSTKDGLQSKEFNLGAVFSNPSTNTLYFGGINGINIFKPNTLDVLDKEGNLKFTSVKIKDEYASALQNKYLKENITKASVIEVNHDDFPINLNFSSLDFRANNNSQYLYKLIPEDDSWNNLGDKKSIQLLNLSPKTYTLEVQGKSRNSIWNKPPLQLNIKVNPPWYKSNLAYALFSLLTLLLFYTYYKTSLHRKLAAQEAKRLKDLDDLKGQFITNITHEFRTPLTVILGYVSTLKESISSKDTEKPLEAIEKNSNDLLKLVNEMLDLAKAEKGKLEFKPTNSDAVSFLNYIVNSFSSYASSNNVTLDYQSYLDALPMDLDLEKMRQVISNLISNAIKFSKEEGNVTLMLKQQDNQAIIEVIDNGIGINKQDLPFVFDRFYRSQNRTQKASGSGIGLALTKELVNLMQGDIGVNSKEGIGTTFTVKLPITNKAPKSEQSFAATKQQDKPLVIESVFLSDTLNTLLIVEDNVEISNYIKSCLKEKYNLLFAENGEIGFKLAQEKIPDLIISDVMMPVMDGFTMTEQLQKTKTTNHIPVIILTAKVMQDDKLTGLKSGADAYITKPFQKQELLLRIETLISKRKQLQEHYSIETIVKTEKKELKFDKNLEFLNQVIEQIHINIENPDYNAAKLASDLFMSDSQLYRKLKAITDKSTAIFIRSVRLEKAKELLETTNLTVSEIAYKTGFSNPNWFGKAFKEAYNTTPTKIRK